jgi:hypothetical protein
LAGGAAEIQDAGLEGFSLMSSRGAARLVRRKEPSHAASYDQDHRQERIVSEMEQAKPAAGDRHDESGKG